ncbi:MAG: FAD-binding protein [Deltaproteobacteria bacterium]|nr:FAD-binding protein [Deltaproteobacteria bacterium]
MKHDLASWEVVKSDVLVIGGGFGGLWAAIRAADCGSTVTLVDKSFAGKSGHSYFAGGAMMVLLPDDYLDKYILDIATGNEWIVDQEMVSSVFENSYDRLRDLESFGISFRKSQGNYLWTRARGTRNIKNLWPENATAADEVTVLRKVALSKDVLILNHVYVYDLLKSADGHICGALGIGVKRARNYLLRAKSIILSTNSGSYRGHHLACELQGTGPFMAYDAGARIKNPEFHYINIRPIRHEIEGSGIMPAMGAKWINAKDLHFMETYDPVLKDRAPVFKIVVSAAKEALKGNAPISIDVESMTEEEREKFRLLQVSHGWMPVLFEKCRRHEGYDPLKDNIEWQPAYESNKLGVDADIDCKTNINGLFASGMARTLGINPFTGWSIAACTWSGYRAGESAASHARGTDFKDVRLIDIELTRENFFNPTKTEKGVDPDTIVHELQKILFPVDVLIIMSEPRLKNALDRVLKLKKEQLPFLKAEDTRTLIKAKEAQTMVLSAEMTLKASLMRRETRENIYYREDCPDIDNRNWLKWIIAERGTDGEIMFSTRDIPLERYPYSPDIGGKIEFKLTPC